MRLVWVRIYKMSIWLFFLLSAVSGYGQSDLIVRQYDKSDGLSQNSIFDIAQDGDGFIWLATHEGLDKFDGRNFFVYQNFQPDSSTNLFNDLRKVYWDKVSKNLWIASMGGLSVYDPVTDRFTNYDTISGHRLGAVYCVLRDKTGNLWIGTSSGLIQFDEKTNDSHFFRVSTDGYDLSQDIFLFQDSRDILWMGTSKGLFIIREENGKTIIQRANVIYPSLGYNACLAVQTIAEGNNGQLWFGTLSSGAFSLSVESDKINEKINHDDGNVSTYLPHTNVRTIFYDKHNNVYFGTSSGLVRYNVEAQKIEGVNLVNESNEKKIHEEEIRSLFMDTNGGFWIGTYFRGILYYEPRLERFLPINYIPDNNNIINSFVEDNSRRLWIGTDGGGLCIKEGPDKFKKYTHNNKNPHSLCGNIVKCILNDNNRFWIGTYQNGFCVTDDPEKGFQSFLHDPGNDSSLSNNNVYYLCRDGNSLWVATFGGGLNQMDINSKTFRHYTFDLNDTTTINSNFCRVIFKDRQNRIWIGTDNGLNLLLNKNDSVSFSRYIPGTEIFSIQQTNSGGLWLGTFMKGMYYFDFQTMHATKVSGSQEVEQSSVYSILNENDSFLWLSSSKGIFRFDTKNKIFTSSAFMGKLNMLEYNSNACFRSSTGDYYFGSINGYITFRPEEFVIGDFKPQLVFTYLDVLGKRVRNDSSNNILSASINYSKKVVFDYRKANFTIGFASLDYFNPEGIEYAYKMEGVEGNWIETGLNSATYTLQRPGEYMFSVKSTNGEGTWNSQMRTILIEVLPPWWGSDFAYFIYVLLFLLIVFALWQYFKLRHSLRVEQIRSQQQAEISKMKLNFFINVTHEFRTPLTLILGPLKDVVRFYEGTEHEPKLKIILKNATRLLNLTNQLMSFRMLEDSHLKMNISSHNIIRFVREIFLTFNDKAARHNIQYEFKADCEEIIVWYDEEKLEKVFYNLLSNAFKFVPDGGTIKMEVSCDLNDFFICIEDNGRGIKPENIDRIFDRYYEDSSGGQEKGYGIGLAMSKDFITLHHGSINVESEYGKGSKFEIRLPLGNEHFKADELNLNSLKENDIANYITNDTVEDSSENTFADPKSLDKNKDVLLIVEDNKEIAKYICSIFSEHFQIIRALNGKEGLHLAYSAMPDIIISDVLMPEMDGITFCQRLKSELAVSHIPVILLTARTASIYEMEGLKIGADDYITKPFDPEILKLKVINIVKTRKKLYKKIQVDNSFDPRKVDIPSPDQDFLAKLFELIESNIENPEFDIEMFTQEMGLSRSLFFKKVKVLTNQTPKDLLNNMRLKRAKQLLSDGKMSVSEVAYIVGFNDPKYFAKCFKKVYNILPSEYSNK